jgi:hypothetical protein
MVDVKIIFNEGTRMAIQAAYLLGAQHGTHGGLLPDTKSIVPAVAQRLREIKSTGSSKEGQG